MIEVLRFLIYTLTLLSIISIESCATAKKPRGCGCGMEERGSTKDLFR
jgi:hypothetical protein